MDRFSPFRLPAALLGLTLAVPAQSPLHAVAVVNDTRSHGQVGDNYLSLNEAIQLNNLTLRFDQLSPAEQAQVSGVGDVSFVRIDALQVPRIVFERDLDEIQDMWHGFVVSGLNGTPVLDMGTTRGIVSRSDFCDFRRLHLRGGTTGITLHQEDSIYGSLLEDLTFEGQTAAGIRAFLERPSGDTRLEVERCRFVNLPVAIDIRDTGSNRRGTVFLADLAIQGGGTAVDVALGAGGSTSYVLQRIAVEGAAAGVRFARTGSGSDRLVLLEALHLRIAGASEGLLLPSGFGPSMVTVRAADLSGGPTSAALALGAPGAAVEAVLEDLRLSGPVALAAAGQGRIAVEGARIASGPVDLATDGASLVVSASILDRVALRATGSASSRLAGCLLLGGSAEGTAAAPLRLEGCHAAGTALGPHVQATGALPAPQLGSMEATPLEPQLGGTLTLQADLPPGLLGLYLLGPTARAPLPLAGAGRLYMDPSLMLVLPFVAQNQDRIPLPVPMDAALRDLDLFVQMAALPGPGLQAPPLALPPGRRVVLR